MASGRVAVLVCLALSGLAIADYSLEITTKSGKVKGLTKTTFDGLEVDTFLGIPYAAPPTDRNRFAPPVEAEPWSGTFDATADPRPCYQFVDPKWKDAGFISPLPETEDCLKLNIRAPKHRTRKSAVMLWIHGGGFTSGSIDQALYDGSNLAAQENVIVVSVNYRLSALGFLYLGTPLAPGNAGLMDQALGMQWVKKNIEAFGGDPERVTIFGESAGGASVGLQLLAPSSLDLFKNAILQSGTGVNFWSTFTPEEALSNALLLAKKAGCPVGEDKEETAKCLQGISVEKLHSLTMELEDRALAMVFRPVVDGKFLPRQPSELLSEGKFCGEKNILIGYTKEDGTFILPVRAPHIELKEDTVFTEEQILQFMSTFTNRDEKISGLQLDLVKHVYTDWNDTRDRISARSQMIHFMTDRWFACAALRTAREMADKGNKVFMFRFDQVPTQTMFFKVPSWMGSSHGYDINYVLGHVTKERGSEDAKVSKQMMRYWANFARNSDPNDDYLATWPQYNTKEMLMLRLNAKALTVDKNDRLRECAFWEHVYPKIETLQ